MANRLQNARALLNQAKHGHLTCTRDHDLNPTFRANMIITEADHQIILKWVVEGLLTYESSGPHGFGIGRLMLTSRGVCALRDLPDPGGVKLVDR